MDRFLALVFYVLALACFCAAALLTLSGFVEFLLHDRWPDQSLLRLACDHRLLSARWFLASDWRMPLRTVLSWLPAAVVLLALAPLWWRLGRYLGQR